MEMEEQRPANDALKGWRTEQHGVAECSTAVARSQSPTPTAPAAGPNSAQYQTQVSDKNCTYRYCMSHRQQMKQQVQRTCINKSIKHHEMW